MIQGMEKAEITELREQFVEKLEEWAKNEAVH
jgi:hypothetical protein